MGRLGEKDMKGTVLAAAAILLLALAASAQADLYVGLYGGGSFPVETDVKNIDNVLTLDDQDFDAGALVGGKVGYWMDRLPWLAGEFNIWSTWANAEAEAFDVTLVNFSWTLLVQKFLGPVRGYLGGGLLLTHAEDGNATSDTDDAVGAVFQLGAEYTAICNWGLFGEYRYAWNDFKFEDTNRRYDLGRHELLAGISYRFH